MNSNDVLISIKNLKKNFNKLEVLKGIDLDIHKSEVISIIGASGSGKSTLIRCLNFLEMPSSGSIIYDGNVMFASNVKEMEEELKTLIKGTKEYIDLQEKIKEEKKKDKIANKKLSKELNEYRKKIGMVFQHFNIFPNMSVLDNITLSPIQTLKMDKELAKKEALELLTKVGLSDKANEFPKKLSGGQKQRLAIVRALAMKPDVMLFDEPTSALDPASREKINEMIFSLKGYTRIIITHDCRNEYLSRFDEIIRL